MKRILTIMAISGGLIVMTQALAGEPGNRSLNRRQVSDCMVRRMSANKAISYIEAAKFCRKQTKTAGAISASNNRTDGRPR